MIDLGWLIGTILVAVLLLACLIVLGFSVVLGGGEGVFTGASALLFAFCAAGLYVWAAYPPFDMRYHTWEPVTGVVAQVDKRLVNEGGGMSEKYVVVLRGDRQQYGCVDTRCSLLQAGERVELSCKRIWIYAATDGYDCRYVKGGGRT